MPPPLTPLQLRERAAQFAQETVENQRESFKRYGVWADWDQPYLTLQPAYEAAQLRVFAAMFKRGSIYRGLKPVWYSPSSRTALAEAELEYPDGMCTVSFLATTRRWRLHDHQRVYAPRTTRRRRNRAQATRRPPSTRPSTSHPSPRPCRSSPTMPSSSRSGRRRPGPCRRI